MDLLVELSTMDMRISINMLVQHLLQQILFQIFYWSLYDKVVNIGDKLQVIINEYIAGQGINPHIDDPSQFGEWIVGISLGSHTAMNFSNGYSQLLYRCSNFYRSSNNFT